MSLRYYETVIMTKPSLSDKKNREVIASLTKSLKKPEYVVEEEYWGVRPLAYPIGHTTKAHYTLLVLHASPSHIEHLSRATKLHEGVLRHLFMKVDTPPKLPSALMPEPPQISEERSTHREKGKDIGKENQKSISSTDHPSLKN